MKNIETPQSEIDLVLNFFVGNKEKLEKRKIIFNIWKNDELINAAQKTLWLKGFNNKDKELFFAAIGELCDLAWTYRSFPDRFQQGYFLSGIILKSAKAHNLSTGSTSTLLKIPIDDSRSFGFYDFDTLWQRINGIRQIYQDNIKIYKLFQKHRESLLSKLEEYFSKTEEVKTQTKEKLIQV